MSYQPGHSLRNSKLICQIVLMGTYMLVGMVTLLVLINFIWYDTAPPTLSLLVICIATLLYTAIVHVLVIKERYKVAAWMLITLYMVLATGMMVAWGVGVPMGLLFFGLVIVLAGILLTAKHSLLVASVATGILFIEQALISTGLYNPDTSWTTEKSSFGDVLGYAVVFGVLALISWLYNREIESSLKQAYQAKELLQQQKATLKQRVEEQTAQLREAQVKEMQHMYRFAELGQVGVTLMHELANYLAALTLEIESMRGKRQSDNDNIAHAREIIRYLETVVDSTRDRTQGKTARRPFDVNRKISEVVSFVRHKADEAGVTIEWQPSESTLQYVGDAGSLSQVLAILMSNAIESFRSMDERRLGSKHRLIKLHTVLEPDQLVISVSDWGPGISAKQRRQLFKPFISTKKAGLGLGLFMAKQTLEAQFDGVLKLSPRTDRTEFLVKLPLHHDKQ